MVSCLAYSDYDDCDGNPSNGCEMNIKGSDVNNCGACGSVCSFPNATPKCVNDSCYVASCNTGYGDCDNYYINGCETNVAGSDVNNCGACGSKCGPYPQATSTCTNGTCGLTCSNGWGDCDGNLSNGCETLINEDVNNCAACGNACNLPNANSYCKFSACQIASCETYDANCDGNRSNGCETNIYSDDNNCGACGNKCGTGFDCRAGVCTNSMW